MTEMYKKLKGLQLEYRRTKSDLVKTSTVFLGDVQRIAKDEGRTANDSDVLAVAKKWIKNLTEMEKFGADVSSDMEFVQKFLPKQFTSTELHDIISSSGLTTMPEIMKYFKQNHDGQYDGRNLASTVKEFLSA